MISLVSRKLVTSTTRLGSRRCYAQTIYPPIKELPKPNKDSFAEYWSIGGVLAGMALNMSAACNQQPGKAYVKMSTDLCVAGTCLAIWSYRIAPTNMLLVCCHLLNVSVQLNLLRRSVQQSYDYCDKKIRILPVNCCRERKKGEIDPHRHHRHH